MITPVVTQLNRHRWGWVLRVPVLADSTADESVYGLDTVDRAYVNLAEALAFDTAPGTAVQMRLTSGGAQGDRPGTVTAWVVGAADSENDAGRLARLVTATLPTEIECIPCTPEDTRRHFDFLTSGGVGPVIVEVRRRLEDADSMGRADESHASLPAVLPWTPEPFALRRATEMLSKQAGRCAVVLHAERTVPSLDVLERLDDIVTHLRFDPDVRQDRLAVQIFSGCIEAKRDLPRAALRVRVAIVGTRPLDPGIAESIGMDLTGLGGFHLAVPEGLEEYDARELLTAALSRPWGYGDIDAVTRELLETTSPASAGAIVRLPQPPVGGLPAIASKPLTTLPRSPQHPAPYGYSGPCILGSGPSGGLVELTLSEINRHVLVAGLPGFGKTTSVQVLLRQLWLDHDIPFLVLDPAKRDYSQMAAELADEGVEHVVLAPSHPAFNPFVVPEGCETSAHAARVMGAFDVALKLSDNWPFGYILLSRAMFKCYEDSSAPTLRDLYRTVGDMIRASDYSGATRSELLGSLLGRLESLVRGPLGAAFATGPDAGIDWSRLLTVPTVVEFRAFSGPTERSLVFALLIAGLASYRESHPPSGGLAHVTVLEEAHRVLAHRAEGQSEGVRLLVEAVAELRGSGEGFIVCDQAPSTLDATLRKVTGSIICHRIVDYDERVLLGNAMLLDPRQAQDLARLTVGTAVVYAAERMQASVVEVSAPSHTPTTPAAGGTRTRHGLGDRDVHPVMCIGCPSICTGLDRALDRLNRELPRPPDLLTRLIGEYWRDDLDDVGFWCTAGHLIAEDEESADSTTFLASMSTLARMMRTKPVPGVAGPHSKGSNR
ncbi:ATP-binding protein [Rhodococcoides corynebacterioides]|uniref:ATP-binding protein n=1 Tax=Rhodococcoides corynebacterioides TaxID=53972 RepID=UPI001C9B874B|nr:DUF87 domain-containing protein [Rhodococcus corynebacterioides]MBY6361515.1 ATP-binding protein [Rhodococcus corynebacterioides]